jgi:CRISPR type III-B/RAMP module-associated protein Cmr5
MNSSRNRPTLDQLRARHAWQKISTLPPDDARGYGRHVKRLPARILTSGLGPALAFLAAKADRDKPSPEKRLLDDLTDWVVNGRGLSCADRSSLLKSIVQGDGDFLRLATDEVMAYARWLVRFADAEGLTKDTPDSRPEER